jgi:endonuclease YncB( thermonuclease family)
MTPTYIYQAEVLSVVDGDTVKLRVDLGLETDRRITVRLADVWAAERHETLGALHTAILRGLLPTGSRVVVQTTRKRGVEATTFGRYVADVWADGEWVNETMRREIGVPRGKGVRP